MLWNNVHPMDAKVESCFVVSTFLEQERRVQLAKTITFHCNVVFLILETKIFHPCSNLVLFINPFIFCVHHHMFYFILFGTACCRTDTQMKTALLKYTFYSTFPSELIMCILLSGR